MKKKSEIILWIVSGATILVFIYIRLRLLTVPFERDEGEYAYAAQLILHGSFPYQDIYSLKFPGVFYCYSFFILLFGHSVFAIRLGALFINLFTSFLIYKTGELLRNKITGLFAGLIFLCLSATPEFNGLIANTEHFVNLFAVLSACFLMRWLKERKKYTLIICGIAAVLACLMKQHGVYFIAVASMVLIIEIKLQKKIIIGVLKNLLLLFTGFIAVGLLLLCSVVLNGSLEKFLSFTIRYGSNYIGYHTFSGAVAQFTSVFSECAKSNWPIWLTVASGIIFSFRSLPFKNSSLLFLWLAFSIASVFPGYYFREHYYLLLLPSCALYSGIFFETIFSKQILNREYIQQQLTIFLFTIIVAFFLLKEKDFFFSLSSSEVSNKLYDGNMFNEAITIGSYLQKHTNPDDKILVVGSEPEIYFYANRKAAVSYPYLYPLTEPNDSREQMTTEFINTAIKNNPAYIVNCNYSCLDKPLQESILNKILQHNSAYGLIEYYFIAADGSVQIKQPVDENEIKKENILWEIYKRK